MLKMPSTTRKTGKAPSDPADPQIDPLYAWEEAWVDWNTNSLTLAECRSVIRTACKKYGVAPPPVRQHKTTAASYCEVVERHVSMQAVGLRKHPHRGGKNKSQSLHEATHWIVHHYCGERPQDHGPTFLGVYLWLMGAARVAPISALTASARAYGLKWVHRPPSWFKS